MTTARFDVFLSHSSVDKPWVSRLKADLGRYGLTAWLDQDDIRPGQIIGQALEEALASSRAVAIIVSPEALASGWVTDEYYRALALTKKAPSLQLIPILYKNAALPDLPGFLENRRWVDFREETAYDQKVWELVWGITGQKPAEILPLQAEHTRPVETLPLDVIPAPAPLPPGSRLPFQPNPLFVGREDDLRALAQALKAGKTTAIGPIAAATGLGGIGKSQLAVEFAYRYGQYFAGGVFWLSFADASAIRAEIAACGGPGAMNFYNDAGDLKLDEQVARVQAAWREALPRLLIFDNCEEEALLAEWRPPAGGCRVLVTSRRPEWDPSLGVQAHPLDVLPRRQSLALLLKFRPDLAPPTGPLPPLSFQERGPGGEVLDALAAELGDLPLALHLAGSFLRTYRHDLTPAAYLADLRAASLLEHESLQGLDLTFSPTNHELHVGRTFALSYNRLDPTDPTDVLALDLLTCAAHFAPGEPIPRELLLKTVELPAEGVAQRRAGKALNRLVELGLLDAETEGALVLHRLLAEFVRELAGSKVQATVEESILQELDNYIDKAGFVKPLQLLEPHFRFVTQAAQMRQDQQAGHLCNRLGYYLSQVGDFSGAKPFYERALHIREQTLGPDHPTTATSLNNLADLLQTQGDYAAARPLYERALHIYEQTLGPDHPTTATSLSDLAELFRTQGDYPAARPLYERALTISEQALGPDHPNTAQILNNLACLLYTQGHYPAARFLFERALHIREKVLGPDHPDTAQSLNNLAELFRTQGHYPAARPLLERALAIREQTLGLDHPDTANSLNSLAELFRTQGDYPAARPLYERALAILEARLGPDHSHTRLVQGNLARLERAQEAGRLRSAVISLVTFLVTIWRRVMAKV